MSDESKALDRKDNKFEFDHHLEFPEGGYGYFVIAATWLVMSFSFGMINSFGVYQTYYIQKYSDQTPFKISVIGSLQAFSIYFFAGLTSSSLHHLGSQLTVFLGMLIQVIGYMLLSITTGLWQIFIIQGLIIGFGAALIYNPAIIVLFQYFKKKRAIAMGLGSSGSCTAGVCMPIAIRRMFDEIGFRWTNRVLGFMYLGLTTVIVLGMKSRLSLKHDFKKDPNPNFLIINFAVAKDIKFLILVFAFLVGTFGLMPGLFYVDLYATKLSAKVGHELIKPEYFLSILNAASVFGRILPSFLGDKFGRMNMLFPFVLLSGIFPLCLWLVSSNSEVVFLIYCILWGFASGVFISIYPAIVTQLHGIVDNQSRTAIMFTICSLGSLFGPMICGSFLPTNSAPGDLTGFHQVAIFTGVMMLGSAFIQLGLRMYYTRKLTDKI